MSATHFMQLIPAYDITWTSPDGDEVALVVAQDDLQAVIRTLLRSQPNARIEILQQEDHSLGGT